MGYKIVRLFICGGVEKKGETDALSRKEPVPNFLDKDASLYLISFPCPLWLDLLKDS